MELSSTINETWKYGAFWSLAGCSIILLFLNQTLLKLSSIPLLGDFHSHPPTYNMSKPLKPVPEHSQITINHPKIENVSINHNHNHTDQKRSNRTKNTGCNMFDGRWVYKPEQGPSYNTVLCPFIEEKFSCRKNGRPDFEYEKWRWQARDCDIPLFNGRDMLEKLRDKRVIIVGDSLSRNQWESLVCLLYSSILPSTRSQVNAASKTYKVFIAKDYNCTVEFYWSPFLVELNNKHESGRRVIVLDKISDNAKQWRMADVMVFNSGHWWTHLGKLAWDLFQYKGKLVEKMPIELAYERGMRTWATWIEKNVDPKKTIVFFRSISADHKGKQWCYKSKQPIMDESYKSVFHKSLIEIIKGIIKGMRNSHVKYLNITKLSQYRRDAHPTVYWTTQSKDKYGFSRRNTKVDCTHWCLPGLPDTWNRLLYASLVLNASNL